MAATNGARKAPSGSQAGSRTPATVSSVLDQSVYDKIFTSPDRKAAKVVIKKKTQASQTEPGNWQDSKSSIPKSKIPNSLSKNGDGTTPTTLINGVESKIASTFPTGRPLDEASDMVLCKHCKKPVYKSAAPSHIRDCLKKKQEKLQKKKEAKEAKDAALRKERNGGISPEPTGEDGNKIQSSAKKGQVDGEGGAKKTGKKRKAEDDGKATSSKKKKKDELKPKTAKHKGPVDVERQCGVLLPNGSMCARSLTCKSHSMGAKRAVPGRSMPYDVLLGNYQKKNQAKLQRAAMDANAPLQDDFEQQGAIDSDEERDAVMAGINRYYRQDHLTGGRTMGAPLEEWPGVPVRRRYNYIRLKGALSQAISGGVHGAKLFSTPAILNTGLFGDSTGDISATLESFDHGSRRTSIASQRQGRKPSISGI